MGHLLGAIAQRAHGHERRADGHGARAQHAAAHRVQHRHRADHLGLHPAAAVLAVQAARVGDDPGHAVRHLHHPGHRAHPPRGREPVRQHVNDLPLDSFC